MMKLLQIFLVLSFIFLIGGEGVFASDNLNDGQRTFTDTEKEIGELKLLVYQQREQMMALSREMDNLKRKVLKQENEITSLKQQITHGLKRYPEQNEDINEDEKTYGIKERKRSLVNDTAQPKQKSGRIDSVAFSAIVNKALIAKENETIPFGYVTLNEGNAYNATSGIFTCPKPGLYLFSFHILSFNSEKPEGSSSAVWLTVNGVPVVLTQETVSAGGNKDFNLHGSIVARLNVTDKVYVASVIDGTVVYYRSSYFNGIFVAD